MRVISQKKNMSVEFDATFFFTQYEFVYANIYGNMEVFGKYETEERAKEVFLEMNYRSSDLVLDVYQMPEV